MDYTGQATVTLSFDQDFSLYPGSTAEVADVDVSVGGGAWQNVLRQTEGTRGPNHQELDFSGIAGNQSDARVRFHYYNAIFDYWWQVDNIRLGPLFALFSLVESFQGLSPGKRTAPRSTISGFPGSARIPIPWQPRMTPP